MLRSLFDLSIVHSERGMYGMSVVRLHTCTRLNNEDAGGNVLTPWCLSFFFAHWTFCDRLYLGRWLLFNLD